MMDNKFRIISLATFAFLIVGCQPNPAILNSQKSSEQPTVASDNSKTPQDEFEFAVKRMQKSGFTHIFAVRRKDGGEIDREDGIYIKQNSPYQANQFVKTDNERAVIIGSNFPFSPENLVMLRDRFSVEDFSPEVENEANTNNN